MKTRSLLTQQRLDTAVLTDARDFAALEEEWAQLYEDCPSATPFQSWAWLYSWWEHYGDGYELRLVTVREGDGLLVGVLPLMLERRWGLGRLLFVGSGLTDYLDMLTRQGWEDRVARAATDVLWDMDGWRVADLQELRPDAAAWALHRSWAGRKSSLWQSNCPVIGVRPGNELLASLSRNHRSTVRRALRRAKEDGIRCELARPVDAEGAADRWIALHQEAWIGRNIARGHLDERFKMHLRVAVRRMTACGLGGISEFWLGDEVVASQFLVFGRDFVGQHLFGATQKTLRRYQVSSLYTWNAIDVAHSKNKSYLDLLRGEEPYKLRWSTRVVPNHRSILGQTPLTLAHYTGYQLLRSKAEAYADSENAPRWVATIVAKYRALRLKAVRRVENRARRTCGSSGGGGVDRD